MKITATPSLVLEHNNKFIVYMGSPTQKTWDKKLVTENYSDVLTWFRSHNNVPEPFIIVTNSRLNEAILPSVPADHVGVPQEWGAGTSFTFSPKITDPELGGNKLQRVVGSALNTLMLKSKVMKALDTALGPKAGGNAITLHPGGGVGTYMGKEEPSRSVTVHSELPPEIKAQVASELARAFTQQSVATAPTAPTTGVMMSPPAPAEPVVKKDEYPGSAFESLDSAKKSALYEDSNFDAKARLMGNDELAKMAADIHRAGLDPHKRDPHNLMRHLSNAQATFMHGSGDTSGLSQGELIDKLYGSLGYGMEEEPEAIALNPNAVPNDKQIASGLGIKLETKMNSLLDAALNEALVGGPLNAVANDGEGNLPGGVPGSNTSTYLAAELYGGTMALAHEVPTSDIYQPLNNGMFGQAQGIKLGSMNNIPANPANMFEQLNQAHKIALGLSVTEEETPPAKGAWDF
jgi:hypothetical protein